MGENSFAHLDLANGRDRRIRGNESVRCYAEVAETASSVEVLWIPSFASRHNCNTFLRADPGAYSTPGAPVQVKQVSSSESFFNGIALFWKL